MKIYLRLNSIPELEGWSNEEKKEAMRAVLNKVRRSWLPWTGGALTCVLVVLALWVPMEITFLVRLVLIGLAGGIGGGVASQLRLRVAIPLMKQWLQENKEKKITEQADGANAT